MTPGAADDDAEDNLNTLLLISISTTIVKTIPRIIQMKNIRLNATTLGINCSSPFTIPGTKNIYIMTPDIIGLIAPPIILTVFITAVSTHNIFWNCDNYGIESNKQSRTNTEKDWINSNLFRS